MFVLIVGPGRVGSAVARSALAAGHEVSVLDEDPLSHERLDVGHGRRPGRTPAAASPSAPRSRSTRCSRRRASSRPTCSSPRTNGDNTNLVIAQIAQRRFEVPKRHRARARPARGPTGTPSRACTRSARRRSAIDDVRAGASGRASLMYVLIVGGGKVGLNLARELIAKGHEVTLIEGDRRATCASSRSSSTPSSTATAPSCGCSSAPGIQRADLVVAVTGDDEDNILICQVAQGEVPLRPDHRPLQQPAEPPALQAARHRAGGQRDGPDPEPHRARGAAATASSTCSTCRTSSSRSSRSRSSQGAPAEGRKVAELGLPDGLPGDLRAPRDGRRVRPEGRHGHQRRRRGAHRARPGLEEDITAQFAPNGAR